MWIVFDRLLGDPTPGAKDGGVNTRLRPSADRAAPERSSTTGEGTPIRGEKDPSLSTLHDGASWSLPCLEGKGVDSSPLRACSQVLDMRDNCGPVLSGGLSCHGGSVSVRVRCLFGCGERLVMMTDWTSTNCTYGHCSASHRSLVLGYFMTLGWFTASPHRGVHIT